MTISHQGADTVVAKTKTELVTVGSTVQIGQYVVPGAGEYDIAGVLCEVRQLPGGLAYFLQAEELHITHLTEVDSEVIKLDDASTTDILVVDIRSDKTPDQLKPILKAMEPAYLFLVGAGATPEFTAALGLPSHDSVTLKVSRSSLPLEGTLLVPRP